MVCIILGINNIQKNYSWNSWKIPGILELSSRIPECSLKINIPFLPLLLENVWNFVCILGKIKKNKIAFETSPATLNTFLIIQLLAKHIFNHLQFKISSKFYWFWEFYILERSMNSFIYEKYNPFKETEWSYCCSLWVPWPYCGNNAWDTWRSSELFYWVS